jgi:hypothetical protein
MIRHMIHQSDTIIESSFPAGHPLQHKLIQAIDSYHNAMKLINSHNIFSEDEIKHYQDCTDEFFVGGLDGQGASCVAPKHSKRRKR